MSHRIISMIVFTLFCLLVVGRAPAFSSTLSQPMERPHACVPKDQKRPNTIKIVGPNERCGKTEKPIYWEGNISSPTLQRLVDPTGTNPFRVRFSPAFSKSSITSISPVATEGSVPLAPSLRGSPSPPPSDNMPVIGSQSIADGAVTPSKLSLRLRTLSINPMGVLVRDGAVITDGSFGRSGVHLPNQGNPSMAFGLTVPDDLADSQNVRIILTWATPSTTCLFQFQPDFIDRARRNHVAATGRVDDGITAPPSLSAPATPYEGVEAIYLMTSGQGFNEILPGDAITLGFYRKADALSDSCPDDLIIKGISFQYFGQ